MRKIIGVIIGIAALTAPITASPAVANSPPEIRILLDQGDFDRAASMGEALATADGLALAAEALAGPVLLGHANNQKDQAEAALDLAEAAVALDPNHAEARLQVALALGFVTRASNPLTVWRKGLAGDLKDAIDAHQTLAPDDARGYALRGAWHYGIVRKAGEKRAENWYKATLTDGNAAYERALELSPHNIIIEANYALSLVDIDYPNNQARAKAMLEDCTGENPKTAIERAVQARMAAVLARWDDREFVEAEAANWLDGA